MLLKYKSSADIYYRHNVYIEGIKDTEIKICENDTKMRKKFIKQLK